MLYEEIIVYVYLVILAIWFILSVFNQIEDISLKISRFDYLFILPRWTFFAPNPGITDTFVIFRTADDALDLSNHKSYIEHKDSISHWREISHPALMGSVVLLLWRPSRRASKAIIDLSRHFYQTEPDPEINALLAKLSFSYLVFCEIVEKLVEPGKQYQWAIVNSHGFQGRRSLRFQYLSGFHRKGPSP